MVVLVMNKIKVINDPSELTPMLRAVDTPVKRDVLKEITMDWKTIEDIEKKFGPEGKEAIVFFQQMKLLEDRWAMLPGAKQPVKAYHSFYTSFHINAQWPIYEISDVLVAAMMPDDEYAKLEEKILAEVGTDGAFFGDVVEKLGLSATMTKSLVRRSIKMVMHGHRIELARNE